jgi:hypothetical protein
MKKITDYTLPELQKAFADKFAEKLENEVDNNQKHQKYVSEVEDFHEFYLENEFDDLKTLLGEKVKNYINFHSYNDGFDQDWRD